jgi:hypothetical protein
MEMQTATVIGLLGLLILVEPASAAERTIEYKLNVTVLEGVGRVDRDQVENLLEVASRRLQEQCNVRFKLGSLGPPDPSASAPCRLI